MYGGSPAVDDAIPLENAIRERVAPNVFTNELQSVLDTPGDNFGILEDKIVTREKLAPDPKGSGLFVVSGEFGCSIPQGSVSSLSGPSRPRNLPYVQPSCWRRVRAVENRLFGSPWGIGPGSRQFVDLGVRVL